MFLYLFYFGTLLFALRGVNALTNHTTPELRVINQVCRNNKTTLYYTITYQILSPENYQAIPNVTLGYRIVDHLERIIFPNCKNRYFSVIANRSEYKITCKTFEVHTVVQFVHGLLVYNSKEYKIFKDLGDSYLPFNQYQTTCAQDWSVGTCWRTTLSTNYVVVQTKIEERLRLMLYNVSGTAKLINDRVQTKKSVNGKCKDEFTDVYCDYTRLKKCSSYQICFDFQLFTLLERRTTTVCMDGTVFTLSKPPESINSTIVNKTSTLFTWNHQPCLHDILNDWKYQYRVLDGNITIASGNVTNHSVIVSVTNINTNNKINGQSMRNFYVRFCNIITGSCTKENKVEFPLFTKVSSKSRFNPLIVVLSSAVALTIIVSIVVLYKYLKRRFGSEYPQDQESLLFTVSQHYEIFRRENTDVLKGNLCE